MQRILNKREMNYIENAIEDYNGFDRKKAYREAQDTINVFMRDIKTIKEKGAYSWSQIAQELSISERTLNRYRDAKETQEVRIPLTAAVYANIWADYLDKNPTKEAKRRERRRKYQERYQREIYTIKGS